MLELSAGDVLRGAAGQFAGERRLRPEDVPHVLLTERGDHEAPARNEFDEPLTTQQQQSFAHRRVADADRLRDRLRAEKVTRSRAPRDDEFAHVARDILGQLLTRRGRPARQRLWRGVHQRPFLPIISVMHYASCFGFDDPSRAPARRDCCFGAPWSATSPSRR